MTSRPDARRRDDRWIDVDWARGLAVLIMIQAHIMDAWTRPAERVSWLYRHLDIVNGFAAPTFLWLAGVALVLAGERTLRRTGSGRAAWHGMVCRGLEIFILALVFRLQSFVFNPGGALVLIFRVDILNVMGPAMAFAGVIWGVARTRARQVLWLGAAAVAVAMLTPIVPHAAWIDVLPTWGQWYLRPAGEHTVFTLLPWSGFVFGGAAAGALLTRSAASRSRDGLQALLAGAGLAILVLGLTTASLPPIYQRSSFWTTSPTFFAVRVGVLLLAGSALHLLARMAAARDFEVRPLENLGRASLFVYWIHVQVVYGWITWPLHHALTVGQALAAVALVSAGMYTLIPVWGRVLGWRQGRGSTETSAGKVAGGAVASV